MLRTPYYRQRTRPRDANLAAMGCEAERGSAQSQQTGSEAVRRRRGRGWRGEADGRGREERGEEKRRPTHRHTLHHASRGTHCISSRIGTLIRLCGSQRARSARCISTLIGRCTGSQHPITASAKGIGTLPRPLHVLFTASALLAAHCIAPLCIPPPRACLHLARISPSST